MWFLELNRYASTAPVAADVLDTEVNPAFDPVTLTVIVFPSCAEVSVNVDAAAPLIATPPANQA